MRDALSILDQAIASCGGRLTAESVRQLVGTAPSGVLEEMMRAVSDGSSETVLRLVDKLLADGQNPTHFARQMVRFLRNAVVAKIAGGESSLLQISSDERRRVASVAELFSEEDLARHLQIMLRTHSELGYRQEQRFHLELGLLKMAHAQRLLPIEQLLSEAAIPGAIALRAVARPAGVPEPRRPEAPAPQRAGYLSPFAADSARKGGNKPELSAEDSPMAGPRLVASVPSTPVVMGAAVPVETAETLSLSDPEPSIPEDAGETEGSTQDRLRGAVLNALGNGGHRMLVSMLDAGEWQVEGNELQIKVAASASLIDMSLGADAKRLAVATASGVLGRPAKLKVISGSMAQTAAPRMASHAGGRSRAEQDPVVRRMREKFGAEIRTIIDYQERR